VFESAQIARPDAATVRSAAAKGAAHSKETGMKSALTQMLCRFLAIATMMLPFQSGQAGMIGTDQAASSAAVRADRDAVTGFLSRSQTVNQLQALGVDVQAAQDRVAALSDAEVGALAGKINALPAGGDVGLLVIVLLVLLIVILLQHR
jgi:uncharacterized protein DUF6627